MSLEDAVGGRGGDVAPDGQPQRADAAFTPQPQDFPLDFVGCLSWLVVGPAGAVTHSGGAELAVAARTAGDGGVADLETLGCPAQRPAVLDDTPAPYGTALPGCRTVTVVGPGPAAHHSGAPAVAHTMAPGSKKAPRETRADAAPTPEREVGAADRTGSLVRRPDQCSPGCQELCPAGSGHPPQPAASARRRPAAGWPGRSMSVVVEPCGRPAGQPRV